MSGRGPAGQAAPPPPWLASATLPIAVVPASAQFVRIHRAGRPALFFSPGAGNPPAGRFDSFAGLFGVLYAAFSFSGAFVEMLLRNPARQIVTEAEIAARSATILGLSRAVRLVRLHGEGLQALGTDNAITTGPYAPCGVWADALHGHKDQPDGIAYASRHDPEQICVALFERAASAVSAAGESVRLDAVWGDVAVVLRRYGKGLVG